MVPPDAYVRLCSGFSACQNRGGLCVQIVWQRRRLVRVQYLPGAFSGPLAGGPDALLSFTFCPTRDIMPLTISNSRVGALPVRNTPGLDVAGNEALPLTPWGASCSAVRCGWLGVALCLLLALVAWGLGTRFPLVGGPVFAILLGIVVGNALTIPGLARPGIAFCSKKILQAAIILLGGAMSLLKIYETGARSLAVMLGTLVLALVMAWLLGRALRVDRKLTSLVGVGTGICGGSAIAAIAPIIEADDDEIAFSISTVFLFNIVAVFIFPLLGHLLHMTPDGFGIWAGTAINDTSSVVAAGYSYGQQAGDVATITKLARTIMIIPIAFGFAIMVGRPHGGADFRVSRVIPWFILGFLGMAVLNTLGALGPAAPWFGTAGKFAITVALAGVGLGANLGKIIKTGARPILLGLLVWIAVAFGSLLIQSLINQL